MRRRRQTELYTQLLDHWPFAITALVRGSSATAPPPSVQRLASSLNRTARKGSRSVQRPFAAEAIHVVAVWAPEASAI